MLLEEDDVEGNQIRIFQERTPVSVCEVKIYGKVYTEVAVRAVEVYSAEADNSHSIEGYKYDIENTLDLIELTSEEDCFVSSKDTEGWAKFLIPWSYVPHIELLTTDSETGDTVEGMSVFVCQMAVDDSCYPCGVIRKTEVASWATVHCTGGMIEGDQVLITHSYRRLQFCDVKIYGLQLDPGKGVVSLVSAVFNDTSLRVERELSGEYVGKYSQGVGGGFPSDVDASLVGRTFSPPRFCPVSDLSSNNWALMHMQYNTIVHRVALLRDTENGGVFVNTKCTCEHFVSVDLRDAIVDVCEFGNFTCQFCGTSQDAAYPEHYEIVHCVTNPRPVGKSVKIYKSDGSLHFCEAMVFGEIIDIELI